MQIPVVILLLVAFFVLAFLVIIGGGELVAVIQQVVIWSFLTSALIGVVLVAISQIHRMFGWSGMVAVGIVGWVVWRQSGRLLTKLHGEKSEGEAEGEEGEKEDGKGPGTDRDDS